MNVRWKPLLILSGLFLCTALAGAGVWIFGFGAGSGQNPESILQQARDEQKAGQFDRALIQYRRAIQASGGASAPIQEEIAGMYAEQMQSAPDDVREELQINRFRALAEAARLDRRKAEPRRILMQEAQALGEEADALRWADELIVLEPTNADANYLAAEKNLDRKAQDLNKARRYLDALVKLEPDSTRVDLLTTQLNTESGQAEKNAPILAKYLASQLEPSLPSLQKVAWARLRILATENVSAGKPEPAQVDALVTAIEPLLLDPQTSINHRVEWTRKLQQIAQQFSPTPETAVVQTRVNQLVEKSLKQAIESNKTDLRLQLALAQHLMTSGNYDACVSMVNAAIESPEAKQPNLQPFVYALRDLAVKSLLANSENKNRFAQALPHIQAFKSAKSSDVQGLGHLFQGAIDLELSGIGGDATPVEPVVVPGTPEKSESPKTALDYRKSALVNLKSAATALPELSTAQALYGVALILNREPELGRQALQRAWKVGVPEVRYQVWTAWSQIMAGYPEDAMPIVTNLMNQAAKDPNVAIFTPTLYLLMGEIYQARNTPEALQLAYEQYAKALSSSKNASNAVHLRVAQLEMILNQTERAQARLKALSNNKETSAAAEQLRIMSLIDQGDLNQARKVLDASREKNPDSVELVMSDASLLAREGKIEDAVKTLAEFGQRRTEVIEVIQLQAQIMAERQGKLAEARKMIDSHLAKNPNSYLLVQSIQLAITARDFPAAQQGIAKLRSQWPDASSADMLSAQMSLAQNNLPGALAHFQTALKKDPTNKVAQFWSAQIEARLGAVSSASQTFQKLVSEAPSKKIDSGLSLTDASVSALASLEIDAGQSDQAIDRLKNLISKAQTPQLVRESQWQLVAAYASKRDWTSMDSVLNTILNSQKPTTDEIVRASNYQRSAGQQDKALALLDGVLKIEPTNSGAAALKGFILADRKAYPEAASAVRIAWKAEGAPVSLALLLAALENGIDPANTRLNRSDSVLVEALKRYPDSVDVIKAIYSLRRATEPKEKMIAWLNETVTDKSPAASRRLKAKILSGEGAFQEADGQYAELILQNSQDFALVVERLQAIRTEIARPSTTPDPERMRTLNSQLDNLLATYRNRFPSNPEMYAIEAEVAADRGQADRAIEISRKIDALNPTSPFGPLVRLRVLMPTGQWPEIIRNLEEAIARDPRRRDLKLQLAGILADQNREKDALQLVNELISTEPDQVPATLLKARLQIKVADEKSRAAQAIATLQMLEDLARLKPSETEIYEEAASIARFGGRPELAEKWLQRGLEQKPDDPALASLLIENAIGKPEFNTLLEQWSKKADGDSTGRLALAVSVGLQRANRLPEALVMAKLAVSKSDNAGAWLNQGGILMAMADSSDETQRKTLLNESLVAYDKVLAKSPNAVEAVNNKAWILHHYLARHSAAAEVVEAFLKRADPSQIPAEFDDTVGSIRESVAQSREAEKAYASGLAKSPEHAMLNYHMGRLLARDPGRKTNAVSYLQKALSGQQRLDDSQAVDARRILAEIQGKPDSTSTLRAN